VLVLLVPIDFDYAVDFFFFFSHARRARRALMAAAASSAAAAKAAAAEKSAADVLAASSRRSPFWALVLLTQEQASPQASAQPLSEVVCIACKKTIKLRRQYEQHCVAL
jgi:hypothetical protein